MIAKTKIKTGGVNTSDAAIIVYKNTKEELPLVGQLKILYLVIPTSELYIWTGDAYCKINGVLEDTLSNLAEKFKNDSELSSSEFAALTLRLEEVDYETKKKFIETYATIESVATSLEEAKQELNETLNILSKDLETYKEESGKELSDLAAALESAEATINEVNTNMDDFMKDGVFETAEIAAIGLMYNLLSQTFNTLSMEYSEAVSKIESIVEKNLNGGNFDEDSFFQEEFPYFFEMKNIWANEEGNVLFNDANISLYIYQLLQNKMSLDSLNLNSLFNLVLCLCLYLPKDKVASSNEITVWNNANTKLTDKLNSFEECLRQTMAAIALFDANDELLEAVGNINSVMNGLLKLIDGQIINWNDKGIPLPLYDHNTNKWFDGVEWVDTVQTEHRGPSLDWDDKYDLHINDTYVDLSTGSAYRWCNTDVGYHWCKITDTATEEVLKRAAELEGALDRKTTTFLLDYPTHPYHKGDLWIVHENYKEYKKGEILNCVTDSISLFDIKDWSRECIYTDDSRAEEVLKESKQYTDDSSEQINLTLSSTLNRLNELFGNGKITPAEKRIILYKLYELFGLPGNGMATTYIWFIQGSGNNIGCGFMLNPGLTSNAADTINLFKSFTSSVCPLVDFCITLSENDLVAPNSGIFDLMTTNNSYRKFLNACINLANHFLADDNGVLKINKLLNSLDLFNLETTETTNQDEVLEWISTYSTLLERIKTIYFTLI